MPKANSNAYMDPRVLERIDDLVDERDEYASRSAFIASAAEAKLERERDQDQDQPVETAADAMTGASGSGGE